MERGFYQFIAIGPPGPIDRHCCLTSLDVARTDRTHPRFQGTTKDTVAVGFFSHLRSGMGKSLFVGSWDVGSAFQLNEAYSYM